MLVESMQQRCRRGGGPNVETARVHRAGPTARATWGAAIMGAPTGRLRQMRINAVTAMGRLPKGSALGFACLTHRAGWRQDPLVLLV